MKNKTKKIRYRTGFFAATKLKKNIVKILGRAGMTSFKLFLLISQKKYENLVCRPTKKNGSFCHIQKSFKFRKF